MKSNQKTIITVGLVVVAAYLAYKFLPELFKKSASTQSYGTGGAYAGYPGYGASTEDYSGNYATQSPLSALIQGLMSILRGSGSGGSSSSKAGQNPGIQSANAQGKSQMASLSAADSYSGLGGLLAGFKSGNLYATNSNSATLENEMLGGGPYGETRDQAGQEMLDGGNALGYAESLPGSQGGIGDYQFSTPFNQDIPLTGFANYDSTPSAGVAGMGQDYSGGADFETASMGDFGGGDFGDMG